MTLPKFTLRLLFLSQVRDYYQSLDPEDRITICGNPSRCILAMPYVPLLPDTGDVAVCLPNEPEGVGMLMAHAWGYREYRRPLTLAETSLARRFDAIGSGETPTNREIAAFVDTFIKEYGHAG